MIHKVTYLLVKVSDQFICWPKGEEINDITRSFKERAGIDGVIGACDGSHVRILCSDKNQQKAYCNRKGFHSMILQVFNLNNGISVIIA